MKKTFEDAFCERNPNYSFLIDRIREATGLDTVTYDDINTTNLRAFRDYMADRVSPNTLILYMSVIKATCREMAADGLIRSEKCLSVLKAKKVPSEQVFLTEEEMARIEQYYDGIINRSDKIIERDVLTLFLLENVTGARASDCALMSLDNISDGRLTYVSKKTKQKSVMPAHSSLHKLLSHMPKREYSRMTKNKIIKRVARLCGITQMVSIYYHGKMQKKEKWEFLGTHSGRRNFATHLAMRGAPITEICQFMNHRSNISMTQRYIVPDLQNVSEASLAFFGQ